MCCVYLTLHSKFVSVVLKDLLSQVLGEECHTRHCHYHYRYYSSPVHCICQPTTRHITGHRKHTRWAELYPVRFCIDTNAMIIFLFRSFFLSHFLHSIPTYFQYIKLWNMVELIFLLKTQGNFMNFLLKIHKTTQSIGQQRTYIEITW